MSDWILLSAGVILEVLVLFRAWRGQSLGQYPFFYAYIACVLVVDVSRDAVFALDRASYANLYWTTQFLSLIVGYGVILEVTRKSLDSYAGAERLSRAVVLGIFLAVFAYVGFRSLSGADWSPANSLWELERDLRAVQAVVLAAVLALVFYYRIPIGRNLSGIILGYGLYTGSSIVSNALRSYAGGPFHAIWRIVQPYTYLLCLLVWMVALWSYQPNPAPDSALQLEVDYESLVGRTRGMLGSMRSLLERSARP